MVGAQSHRRVKDIDYDDEDMYSDNEEQDYDANNNDLAADDKAQFATLTPVVRAELDEAGLQASDREIEDALWNYYWDVGKSVTYLRNAKQPKARGTKQPTAQKKAKSKFDEAQEARAKRAEGAVKPQSKGTNGLEQKTQNLKLGATSSTQTPTQRKAKTLKLDVPRMWVESKSQRNPSAAFVVIGHIDHGKSTLMGRLLLDTGAVQQRDIDKYGKQAAEMGKESFALAWAMDNREDEREFGVTIDISQHYFSTDKADFTILDAPGHRDFVPSMITGACIADLGVVVIDANQLESGLKGQTREHVQIVKAIGLKRVIVAVNKMDSTTPTWDETHFNLVKGEVLKLLTELGYKPDDVKCVPCAGFTGENVVKSPPATGPTSWVANSCQTLIQALEQSVATIETPIDLIKTPFRLRINHVFCSSGDKNPDCIAGRLESGNVQVNDTIIIQPCGEQAEVKGIEVADQPVEYAVAGQIASLRLATQATETLEEKVRKGDMASSISDMVEVVTDFTARYTAIDHLWPRPMELHIGALKKSGNVVMPLGELLDKHSVIIKKKPKVVKPGQFARIKIKVEEGIALDVDTAVIVRGTEGLLGYCIVEQLGERGLGAVPDLRLKSG